MTVNNIFFILEDKESNISQADQYNIQKMWDEIPSTMYNNCNTKNLLKICQYYNIVIKNNNNISTTKKQDIINKLICFENVPENDTIVRQRLKMWECITELSNDSKMKKYLLWI
jgi:hypothetical protein